MLGKLFGRKKTQDQPKPASSEAVTFSANPMFQIEVLSRLFQQLKKTGSFQGSFQEMPKFVCQQTEQGLEVCKCNEELTGLVLDNQNAGAMFGVSEAIKVALISTSSFFKQGYGVEPDWDASETENGAQLLKAKVPVGNGFVVELECTQADVDPLFTGNTMPGSNLIIKVNQPK